MAQPVEAPKQRLVTANNITGEFSIPQSMFNNLVDRLIKNAPNVKAYANRFVTPTRFDGEPPTHQEATFNFRNARVTASYDVDYGSAPRYELEMQTPISLDSINADLANRITPIDPHEILEVTSCPYHGSLDIVARAVTRLGDFGTEIVIAEYTAGGLLPPIGILGRQRLQTIEAVVNLFRGFSPKDPVYRQPI